MIGWFTKLFTRRDVSDEWLASHRRTSAVEEHHAPSIKQWPIKKQLNEASEFQTERLRRQTKRKAR